MKQITILLLTIFIFAGCGKNDDSYQVSVTSKKIYLKTGVFSYYIDVHSNAKEWYVKSDKEWCSVVKNNDHQLLIKVTDYIGEEDRKAILTVKIGNDDYESIEITQQGRLKFDEITIPVIYTVLHTDDSKPNVPYDIIKTNFEVLRRFFRNEHQSSEGSVDTKINFVLAATDPYGNTLETPGFRFLEVPFSVKTYTDLTDREIPLHLLNEIQWDLNNYINIYLFDEAEKGIVGRASLPYTPSEKSLPGLYASDYYFNPANEVTIVRLFMLDLTFLIHNPKHTTVVHEMGHYLGLIHCFSNECMEDDFCEDTPNYNRKAYTQSSQKYDRTACDGTTFISRNVMDYNMSYLDCFTPQQNVRMQHVLNYSPLTPGRGLKKSDIQFLSGISATIKPPVQIAD